MVPIILFCRWQPLLFYLMRLMGDSIDYPNPIDCTIAKNKTRPRWFSLTCGFITSAFGTLEVI